jgi:dUTP pyrophosphatase
MPLEIARFHENAALPSRGSLNAAGLDLFAAETVTIYPGERRLIGTGIAMALAPWHVGIVCPRSGMAERAGITVLNAPGVIDPDYRGEVGVILINTGDEPYRVVIGARIAQLVIVPFASPRIVEVDALPGTKRGSGGFGSTGT